MACWSVHQLPPCSMSRTASGDLRSAAAEPPRYAPSDPHPKLVVEGKAETKSSFLADQDVREVSLRSEDIESKDVGDLEDGQSGAGLQAVSRLRAFGVVVGSCVEPSSEPCLIICRIVLQFASSG